jgi:hypothetical protein
MISRRAQGGLWTIRGLLRFALLGLGLVACTEPVPELEPAPARILRVSGVLPPETGFVVFADYVSTARYCERTVNWLEGVSSPRHARFAYPAEVADGRFSREVPLDLARPGVCRWTFRDLAYRVRLAPSMAEERSSPPEVLALVAEQNWPPLPALTEVSPVQIRCWPTTAPVELAREHGLGCQRRVGGQITAATVRRLFLEVVLIDPPTMP